MTPWLVHELPTLLLEVNTRSKKSESPSAMPTSHPKGTPRTGLCQQSNRSAVRRYGNWKMTLRDRRPKPAPQGPKCQKLPDRDWGAPASPAGMSRILTHREIKPRRPDCLAEERVNGEPVMRVKFPQGTLQGILRKSGRLAKNCPQERSTIS